MAVEVTLYNNDCIGVLRMFNDQSLCVITDPPYGIKRDKGFGGAGGWKGKGKPIPRTEYEGDWDSERPDKTYFDEMLRVGKIALIFGGNFFADLLPVGKHWIVWDKLNTMPTFGDCELVWTNVDRNSVKKYTYEYNGLIGREKVRYHATQKPESLMRWLVLNYTKPGDTVLDPFMGSGTTGVACVQLGRNFIGVERDQSIFDIAQKRINDALKQPSLLDFVNTETAVELEQLRLF